MSLVDILAGVKSFIEKLSAKLSIKDSFKFFSDNKTYNIHLYVDGTQGIDIQKGQIRINPDRIPAEDKPELQKHILEAVNSGAPLLTTETNKFLEDLRTTTADKKDVLDALHGTVDPMDMQALRAAYVLRARHEKGEDISQSRYDIIRVAGDRGRKISNLCTAGYFETLILPTYREMKKSADFRAAAFVERYNIIVEEEAFSVFVHVYGKAEKWSDTIIKKLDRNKSYGNHYVNVHAIGETNIKTVREALKVIREKRPEIQTAIDQPNGKSLYVRLEVLP